MKNTGVCQVSTTKEFMAVARHAGLAPSEHVASAPAASMNSTSLLTDGDRQSLNAPSHDLEEQLAAMHLSLGGNHFDSSHELQQTAASGTDNKQGVCTCHIVPPLSKRPECARPACFAFCFYRHHSYPLLVHRSITSFALQSCCQ
jgi:hypothetical protein